eukprot:scaffold2645_cov378-Prasinococcus_capsulatus_cf.AAC.16
MDGGACSTNHQPVHMRAGQKAVQDDAANADRTQPTSSAESRHVVAFYRSRGSRSSDSTPTLTTMRRGGRVHAPHHSATITRGCLVQRGPAHFVTLYPLCCLPESREERAVHAVVVDAARVTVPLLLHKNRLHAVGAKRRGLQPVLRRGACSPTGEAEGHGRPGRGEALHQSRGGAPAPAPAPSASADAERKCSCARWPRSPPAFKAKLEGDWAWQDCRGPPAAQFGGRSQPYH